MVLELFFFCKGLLLDLCCLLRINGVGLGLGDEREDMVYEEQRGWWFGHSLEPFCWKLVGICLAASLFHLRDMRINLRLNT